MPHPITVTPQLLEERGELVVCRSLSKAYCLLGARVGYALTSATYADRLRRHQLPYGVGSPAIAAAHAALRDGDNLRRNVHVVVASADSFCQRPRTTWPSVRSQASPSPTLSASGTGATRCSPYSEPAGCGSATAHDGNSRR